VQICKCIRGLEEFLVTDLIFLRRKGKRKEPDVAVTGHEASGCSLRGLSLPGGGEGKGVH